MDILGCKSDDDNDRSGSGGGGGGDVELCKKRNKVEK